MEANKTLSVIVPAYNVEEYLSNTLETMSSICNFNDVEVIVVNHGSKANTVEIANKYKDRYPESIIVVDKENGGHGSTINAGIKVATGKYFKVIDGDDWVDSKQFEKFIECLKKVDADLLLSPFTKVYEDVGEREEVRPTIRIEEGEHHFNEFINDIKDFYCMHAVTFKTCIYKKVPFPITEHCFYVDMEFILYPINYISSFQYIDQCVYQYRLGRPGQSVSMKSKIKNKDMHKQVIFDIATHCIEEKDAKKDSRIEKYVYYKFVTLVNIQYSIYLSMEPTKSTYNEMKEFKRFIDSVIPNNFLYGISKIIHIIPISFWIVGLRYRKVYS